MGLDLAEHDVNPSLGQLFFLLLQGNYLFVLLIAKAGLTGENKRFIIRMLIINILTIERRGLLLLSIIC